jgi:hypothetical protein
MKLQFFILEIRNMITDIQLDNKYFIFYLIFIKLNVLKLPEKNYFCGVNFLSLNSLNRYGKKEQGR